MILRSPSPWTRSSLRLASILIVLAGVFSMHVLDCRGSVAVNVMSQMAMPGSGLDEMHIGPSATEAPSLVGLVPAAQPLVVAAPAALVAALPDTGGMPMLGLCVALAIGAVVLFLSRFRGRADVVVRSVETCVRRAREFAQVLDPPGLYCLSIQRC